MTSLNLPGNSPLTSRMQGAHAQVPLTSISVIGISTSLTSSTAILNAGDGQVIAIDAILGNNAYTAGSPNFGAGRLAWSIAPALSNSRYIHTYILDSAGDIFRRVYQPQAGWVDDWLHSDSTEKDSSHLSASYGLVDSSSVYSMQDEYAHSCFGYV
jgi:hypothetical protein